MISQEKLKLLHAIRGFAALVVVISHAKFPFWSGGREYVKAFPMDTWNIFDYFLFIIDMFTSISSIMVMVFFVLSGFFIAYSFEKNRWSIKNFYINRTIRIYTTFFGSVIFAIILFKLAFVINPELLESVNPRQYNQNLVRAYEHFNLKTFLWTLLFYNNPIYITDNFPYWSLLVEIVFYFLAPFLIKRVWLFLFLGVTGFVLSFIPMNINYSDPLTMFLYSFFGWYFIFFALGCFTFWLIFKYKIHERIKPPKVWLLNGVSFVLIVTSCLGAHYFNYKYSFLLGAFFSMVMIYRLLHYPVKITFIHNFFISMGKISYTMYLIHIPIFTFIYAILVKVTGIEVFYSRIYWIPVILAVLLSYPMYFLVEHQSLKLIRYFKSRIKEKQ